MSQKKPEELDNLVKLIEERVKPYTLSIHDKDNLRILLWRFDYELLVECVYISSSQYIQTDRQGNVTHRSAQKFFDSLGGIATNKKLPPIQQAIKHVLTVGRKRCIEWCDNEAKQLLDYYAHICLKRGTSEKEVADELDNLWVEWARNARTWNSWQSEIYLAIERMLRKVSDE